MNKNSHEYEKILSSLNKIFHESEKNSRESGKNSRESEKILACEQKKILTFVRPINHLGTFEFPKKWFFEPP